MAEKNCVASFSLWQLYFNELHLFNKCVAISPLGAVEQRNKRAKIYIICLFANCNYSRVRRIKRCAIGTQNDSNMVCCVVNGLAHWDFLKISTTPPPIKMTVNMVADGKQCVFLFLFPYPLLWMRGHDLENGHFYISWKRCVVYAFDILREVEAVEVNQSHSQSIHNKLGL